MHNKGRQILIAVKWFKLKRRHERWYCNNTNIWLATFYPRRGRDPEKFPWCSADREMKIVRWRCSCLLSLAGEILFLMEYDLCIPGLGSTDRAAWKIAFPELNHPCNTQRCVIFERISPGQLNITQHCRVTMFSDSKSQMWPKILRMRPLNNVEPGVVGRSHVQRMLGTGMEWPRYFM